MKNIGHPNMFPDISGATEPIESHAITDADVGGIANASTPASPWANPLSTLKQSAPAAAAPRPEKSTSRTEQVIAYLREHGPSASGDICEALGMNLDAGVAPYVVAALKNGRIIRLGRKYALPCHVGEQLAGAPATASVSAPAENPAAKHGRPRRVAEPGTESSHSPERELSRPAAADAYTLPAPTERTPDFTLFTGALEIISWPDGAITIRSANNTIEMAPAHARVLSMLLELRK